MKGVEAVTSDWLFHNKHLSAVGSTQEGMKVFFMMGFAWFPGSRLRLPVREP